MLTSSEKALHMLEITYGKLSSNCTASLVYDDNTNITEIVVRKGKAICWSVSLAQLTFDYMTRDM